MCCYGRAGLVALVLRGLRGVGELAEQAGYDEYGLLGNVDGVVRDALDRAGDKDHEHGPFAQFEVVADLDGASTRSNDPITISRPSRAWRSSSARSSRN